MYLALEGGSNSQDINELIEKIEIKKCVFTVYIFLGI